MHTQNHPIFQAASVMKRFPLLISQHASRESAGRVRLPPVIFGSRSM
jgi:hypothetical protein